MTTWRNLRFRFICCLILCCLDVALELQPISLQTHCYKIKLSSDVAPRVRFHDEKIQGRWHVSVDNSRMLFNQLTMTVAVYKRLQQFWLLPSYIIRVTSVPWVMLVVCVSCAVQKCVNSWCLKKKKKKHEFQHTIGLKHVLSAEETEPWKKFWVEQNRFRYGTNRCLTSKYVLGWKRKEF